MILCITLISGQFCLKVWFHNLVEQTKLRSVFLNDFCYSTYCRKAGWELRYEERGIGWESRIGRWVGVQADRLLASSMSARAPWRRSRCSWRRRLAAPPWLPFSSSAVSSSSPFSSSDWRNSMGSCCSWSSALALPCGFAFVVVGARCSRVRQYLRQQKIALTHAVSRKSFPFVCLMKLLGPP